MRFLHKQSERAKSVFARKKNNRAFTLLEVVLALTILGVALAFLGEGMRFGLERIQTGRNELHATMVAESILAEIVAGARAAEGTSNSTYESDPRWVYSIESESLNDNGLMSVKVTVLNSKELVTQKGKVTLTRWITDPEIAAADEESQSGGGAGSTSTSSSSSSKSSSTNSSNSSNANGTTTNK